MAAAEYYNATAQAAHQSPYQQSPYQRPQELGGSPIPNYNLTQQSKPPHTAYPPPPPPYQSAQYQPVQNNQKPSVHFAPRPSTSPQGSPRPNSHRPSFSNQSQSSHQGSPRPNSHRPSFTNQPRPNQGQHLQPPPYHAVYGQNTLDNTPPQLAVQPPHMRPYMNGNQSQYSLKSGYSSDPEQRRRRRHKHHERKDDRSEDRDLKEASRPSKHRSRSTNADSFLGAAGGGLIGDLIFPGLGTVGGAVAGWIGGRDYGKHRKYREGKLHREQEEWETRFRGRSHSSDRRNSEDRRHSDDQRHDRHRHHPH